MGDIYTIACEFDIKRHDPCDLLASLQKANALSLAGAAHGQGYEGSWLILLVLDELPRLDLPGNPAGCW